MKILSGILGVTLLASTALSQTFVGTILAAHGDVKVLHTPNPSDAGPFAQIEGTKYAYEEAKIGKKINPGEVIQCGADGKAKIVYPNGDAFFVGNGTSFLMPDVSQNKTGESVIKLFYGRLRSLISKAGPRNKLKVTTPEAVAGVRGTDFFVRSNPTVGTQLTVLRGAVGLQSSAAIAAGNEAETISVNTAFMAQVLPKSTEAPKATEATREELTLLKDESAIQPAAKELAALDKPVHDDVVHLDQMAKAAALADIKNSDPAMYRDLGKQKNIDVDHINASVVDKLFKVAPAEKKKKPTKGELDSSGNGVYDKYYDHKDDKTKQ